MGKYMHILQLIRHGKREVHIMAYTHVVSIGHIEHTSLLHIEGGAWGQG